MAIRGDQRRSEAIRGPQRPSEVIRGDKRRSKVLRVNQSQSESIRGNPRQSEAITYLDEEEDEEAELARDRASILWGEGRGAVVSTGKRLGREPQ
jgi:hypothetical protein